MNKQISFSGTLYDCATECALKRQKKICRNRFNSMACNNCRLYVKNYIDADPRHVELFMIQAETRAYNLKKASNSHHFPFLISIIVCLLLAWYYHYIEFGPNEISKPRNFVAPTSHQSNIYDDITSTLRKVQRDLENGVDVNRDNKVNCIDAAVQFYKHFPDKSKVCILVNRNEKTGMNHLFNGVLISGTWRAIEPQAYHTGWSVYYMRDIWGNEYDSSLNKDVTQNYLKYVK